MGEDVSDQGERAGQQARHSTTMRAGARVGLAAYGVVHLLVAWLAMQVAWSGGDSAGGEGASGGGALRTLAEQPFGSVLLWITVAGLVVLALWQLLAALLGYRSEDDDRKRAFKRLSAVARAVAYGFLAFLAARIASGSGGGGGSTEEGLTADLLAAPAGRVLVGLVALAILALALRQAWRGITDGFTNDLELEATTGASGSAVLALGRIGYVAKGVAFAIIAVLFAAAAFTYDADKAGGLDDALGTLRDQPFGPYLLTAVALGIAAFGAFCFVWARHARTR